MPNLTDAEKSLMMVNRSAEIVLGARKYNLQMMAAGDTQAAVRLLAQKYRQMSDELEAAANDIYGEPEEA